ncbi:MAG: hypothetical protein AAGB29_04030 [Planctomycetota bacterium]
MWRVRHTAAAVVWCGVNAIAGGVWAQGGPVDGVGVAGAGAETEAAPEVRESAATVAPADGLLALDLVQGWARRGSVEPGAGEPAGRAMRSGLFGVRVCLRRNGRVVGIGEAYRRDIDEAGEAEPVDMVGLLRTATEDALSAARRRGAGGAGSGETVGVITASVELGYGRRRLAVDRGGAAGLASAGWSAGSEGLRVAPVAGRGVGGVSWPAWGLATNMDADRQLARAMSGAGYEPGVALGMMAVPGRVVERFSTVHAARPEGAAWPVRYERGLPTDEALSAATSADVERAGRRLAEHLLMRVTDDGVVLGDYEPAQDRWDPVRSSGVSLAAVLLAMTEAREAGWVRPGEWGPVEAAMRSAVAAWSGDAGGESAEAGLAEGGLLLGALADPVWSAGWADRARAALAEAVAARLWGAGNEEPTGWGVGESMALWGLARAVARSGEALTLSDAEAERVEAGGEAMLRRGDVAGLWWLGRAGEAAGSGWVDPSAEARAAVGLMSTQRLADPLGGRRGEAGGLMGVEPAGAAGPTWKTAAGLGWLASLARRAEEPGGRFTLLLGVSQAAGFIERLQLTPTRLWYGVDRPAALYGVRASLTDHALAAGPNAISLLALIEAARPAEDAAEAPSEPTDVPTP